MRSADQKEWAYGMHVRVCVYMYIYVRSYLTKLNILDTFAKYFSWKSFLVS